MRPGMPPLLLLETLSLTHLLSLWTHRPRRPLLRWWLHWRQLKPPLGATDLIAAGARPGPELGERLRALRAQRLDQERL